MRVIDVGGNYTRNGEQVFSRLQAQKLLGVVNRGVWRQQLITVGINPDSDPKLGWEDIKTLLALRLFLQAGEGYHSKAQFRAILNQGLIPDVCQRFDIDLDSELEKIQHDYYQHQKQAA